MLIIERMINLPCNGFTIHKSSQRSSHNFKADIGSFHAVTKAQDKPNFTMESMKSMRWFLKSEIDSKYLCRTIRMMMDEN